MLERELHLAVDEIGEHLARAEGLVAEAEHHDPVVQNVLQHLAVQRLLVADVVVQLGLGQTRLVGDGLGGRAGHALVREHLDGGLIDVAEHLGVFARAAACGRSLTSVADVARIAGVYFFGFCGVGWHGGHRSRTSS